MTPQTIRPDRTCILTLQAASPGGVPALVDAVYGMMLRWGYAPTIYRSHFIEEQIGLSQRIAATVRNWSARDADERSLPAKLVPAPPLPLWLFYAVPQFTFGSLLGQYPAAFVISGSAHVALPLALREMPYTLWIATLYEDELRAKTDAGDAWASGVLNSPMWPVLEWQERLALRRAGRVLALSPHTAKRILEVAPEVEDRLETVLFPVDLTRFHPEPAAREKSPYGRYLMLAARINDPRKNVGLLLRAFKRVHDIHPDLNLVLVGDEPGEPMREMVRALGIEEAVTFGGIVSADDLLHLYQGAELFALPSFQEGLGIVMLEALACGTPVVSTACGGPEGVITDGVTGQIVHDFHDDERFADAILGLLDDPAALQAMRAQCADFAAENFSYPVVSEQLREAYEAVQNEPPRASRLRSWLAMGWALLVLGAYVQHQLALHWESIQLKIIDPLVSILS